MTALGSDRPVAIVTGASSGIGEVFARKLAGSHDLVLVARRRERLEALAAQLSERTGCRAEGFAADLSEEGDLARLADRIAGEQRLALLVNNAGFGSRRLFWEAPLEAEERMHRLHVMATVRLCHAALGNLVPRNCGAIINVASVAAFARSAGSSSYGATKSWMTAFTEGLHLELKSKGSAVRVQALCPGFTYSEFHDVLKVRRESMAGKSFWLSAEEVVAASLGGLERRRLYGIPGWRYRLLVALLTKFPTALRLAAEALRPVAESERT
jgi:short-subunit dehydrogenase